MNAAARHADVELPAGAKVRPTYALRWKSIDGVLTLQQRFFVDDKKAAYFIWRVIPVVGDDAED
jgi:hypothetical protein